MKKSILPFSLLHCFQRQNLRDILPLVKPFTLIIEPSSLCNFRCKQCFQSIKSDNYFNQNRENMTLERFQKIVDQATNWQGPLFKVLKLSLYGEPLINKNFSKMLKIAREAEISERIELTTNASLLNRSVAEKLVELQLDYLRVSIYATEKNAHQEITKSSIDPENIYLNLLQLKKIKKSLNSLKPFVSAKMMDTYSKKNDHFLMMYHNVADEVFVDKPHSWIAVEETDFLKNYYGDQLLIAQNDILQNSKLRKTCPIGFTTLAVRSNGDVSPCCVDFIGSTNFGHIDSDNIKNIWNSKSRYDFLKMQLKGQLHENLSCKNCSFFKNDFYIKDDIDGLPISRLSVPLTSN